MGNRIFFLNLTTQDVEYGYYANCVDLLASTLIQCINQEESSKFELFEHIQNFLMDLDRAILVINNNNLPSIERHNDEINTDTKQLIEFLSKMNSTLK